MKPTEGPDDLVGEWLAGDRNALELLFAILADELKRWIAWHIWSKLRGRIDPEEILQGVFMAVERSASTFEIRSRHPFASFRSWVWTITRYRFMNEVRKHRQQKRNPERELPNSAGGFTLDRLLASITARGCSPSRCASANEAKAAVAVALRKLPDDQRMAVWRRYAMDYSVQDVAEWMGKSQRAVHGLCRRARERLEELLVSASRFRLSTP